MPDLKEIIESIERTLKWIFPDGTPPWLLKGIGYIIGVALLLLALWGLLYVLSKIKKLWIEEFWPLFYKKELKKRRARRQRFADHIEGEIRRLNTMEAWSDCRFAELEAEVEAEGRRRSPFNISFFHKVRTGVRREASLSNALKQSQERLIILEGDPGAGKSVALRHVAKEIAAKAFRSRRIDSPIPLYINLKALERSKETPIDLNLIKSFILESLNRANDIDISRFLDEEFDRGLKEGTWLFLFDSFDELPEILSVTDTDSVISNYTDAVSDFLHGFNRCRGIIASRQFRGPKQFGWPRFRILPLSEERRLQLIRRADLDPQTESDLIGHLGLARNEIYAMASNPMFLSLLCEHMRGGQPFPVNAHGVFETYVGLRLTRDRDRVRVRFGVEATEVRAMAEVIAFCMAADTELGLIATRQSIREAAIRLNITIEEQFHPILDALEYIKLARSEDSSSPSSDLRTFTFAHRRFQEYFATSVVLREPERVSPRQLLHDARWRETAVVMCQTQDMPQLQPLIQEVNSSLNKMVDHIREHIDIPKDLLDQNKAQNRKDSGIILSKSFPWPYDALHILSLLQDGFISRTRELPDDIRTKAGLLVVAADQFGTLIDKKWALELAGIIPQLNLLSLLREAFSSRSQWLQDNAYRQAAHLSEIPSDIAKWIRKTLVYMALKGNLWRQRHSVRTFLSRLENPTTFTSALRLILLTWLIDLFLLIILVSYLIGGLINPHLFFSPLRSDNSVINIVPMFTVIFISWGGFWWLYKIRAFTGLFKIRILFFTTYVRMMAPCWAILTLIFLINRTGNTPHSQEGYLSATIMLLLFAWAPSALYCAEKGKFTNPTWWPILSFVGIILLFVGICRFFLNHSLSRIVNTLRSKVKLILLISVCIALIAVLIVYMMTYHSKPFISIIIIVYGFVLLGGLGLGFLWLADFFKWLYWAKHHKSLITGKEFLELLCRYRYSQFVVKSISMIRTQNLLQATDETQALIGVLGLKLENSQHTRHLKRSKGESNNHPVLDASVTNQSDDFNAWNSIGKNSKKLEELHTYEMVDEVYKLYEQIQFQKQKE